VPQLYDLSPLSSKNTPVQLFHTFQQESRDFVPVLAFEYSFQVLVAGARSDDVLYPEPASPFTTGANLVDVRYFMDYVIMIRKYLRAKVKA